MNIKQLLKYGLVGIFSTLIHISIAFLYIYSINENVLFANISGFCIAFIFSYTVQSLYVFEHKLQLLKTFKYFLVQFSALIIAYFASNILYIENAYIHTILISFLLPLVTFFIHKFWTFKQTHEEDTAYATK